MVTLALSLLGLHSALALQKGTLVKVAEKPWGALSRSAPLIWEGWVAQKTYTGK